MQIPVRSRTIQELSALSTPAQGQLEAVSWKYFDTQAITSTTTTTLNFFNTVQNDKTLGNIEAANQIQSPNWFELYAIKCDFLFAVTDSATATAGPLNDIATLLNTQRAYYEFSINSKSYGKVPLRMAHCSGGPVGLIQGTAATNHVQSFANNSIPDDGDWLGGWWLNPTTGQQEQAGSIVIPPTQSFSLNIVFAAAPTINTTPLNCVLTMCGVLHRQVR